jgi:hypothetical protein
MQSMLEKAEECDRNAAAARLSETQNAFSALAEQWRRLAVEIQQSEPDGGEQVDGNKNGFSPVE